MTKYGGIPEIQELEKVHTEIHAIVTLIIERAHAGDIHLAETDLAKLRLLNEKIIVLLNSIEEKIKPADKEEIGEIS